MVTGWVALWCVKAHPLFMMNLVKRPIRRRRSRDPLLPTPRGRENLVSLATAPGYSPKPAEGPVGDSESSPG